MKLKGGSASSHDMINKQYAFAKTLAPPPESGAEGMVDKMTIENKLHYASFVDATPLMGNTMHLGYLGHVERSWAAQIQTSNGSIF